MTTECVQRAAAFVAARSRGDFAAADELLGQFDNDAQRVLAFAMLAELSMRLLADYDQSTVDEVASRLAVAIAQSRG